MKMLTLLALVAALGGCARAQGGEDQPAGLSESDISAVVKAIGEARKYDAGSVTGRDQKKLEKAETELRDLLKGLQEKHKDRDILSLTESWSKIFTDLVNAEKKKNRVSGLGIVKTNTIIASIKGEDVGFDYAYRYPKDYTPDKAWPLIIALHDEGSDCEKYLKEVWDVLSKNVETRKILDEVVLVAPSIGPRTASGRRLQPKRMEWFDFLFLRSIYHPVREILTELNIDTNRMYLEGTGTGGAAAIQLASLRAKDFAAVAVRSALPKRLDVLPGHASVPLLVVGRKDGPLGSKAGQDALAALTKLKEAGTLSLEVMELDGLPDENQRRRALGTQKNDPVHDATPAIAAFLLGKVRDPYPSRLLFVSDYTHFVDLPWVKLIKLDTDPAENRAAVFEANVERATNTVDVKTENIEDFTLLLNDRILNLDQPIKVRVNGQDVVERKLDRAVEALLKYQSDNPLDPAVVFPSQVTVKVPVKLEETAGDADGKKEGGEEDGKTEGQSTEGDREKR